MSRKRQIPERYGLPIIRDKMEIFEIAAELGIKRWQQINSPQGLEEFAKQNPENENLIFAPKIEVLTYRTPYNDLWYGFRSRVKDGTVVFCKLPDELIPICAEYRHGADEVMLNLPGGVYDDSNAEKNAKEEFVQETGIVLNELIRLSNKPMMVDGRRSVAGNHIFIGLADNPPLVIPRRLDKNEFVATFLVHLNDWLWLIENGYARDGYSVAATLLALNYFNKIKHG